MKLQRLISRGYSVFKLPATSFVPSSYEGPEYDTMFERRKQYLPPVMRPHFKKPLLIHQGHMQWLFDHEGRRYLDMFGGIVTVSVGHCHPRITKALKKQAERLWHVASIYMHPSLHEYIETLLPVMPGKLKVVYLMNSGSEANDLAILLARLYTGNQDILSLRNSYHGGNATCMALGGMGTWKYPLNYGNIHHVALPDVYRGQHGGGNCRDSPVQARRNCACSEGECQASQLYLQDVKETIQYSTPRGKVAGFIAESIQGVGGCTQYPKGYLKGVYKLIRENGGVCIADEVQTGFGRTGDHFWGFQGHEVMPDIVTMAKGIGNGFPLAAVVTTPDIAKSLERALHYNTFSGNPQACAVGNEVLKVIKDEGMQENSLRTGTHLLKRLDALRDKYDIIGDVRGKGLMIGVEMVADPKSKEPLPSAAISAIWEACREQGLLIALGGLHANVFRIKPPMCITMEDVNFTVDVFEHAILQHYSTCT